MGIFYEQCEYINRDCIQRTIMFDGQRIYVKANYDEEGTFLPNVKNYAPRIVAPYAMNQNVVMGSESATDPSGFESYVVPLLKKRKKGRETDELKFDISFLSSKVNKATTRVDLSEYLDDPSLKVLEGRGAFSAGESGGFTNNRTGIANQSLDE